MTGTMEVADPHYREGDRVSRDRIAELFADSPFIANADTLDALAREIGVDEAAFLDTVARYNRSFDEGLDAEPEFGKPLAGSKKFDTPPYSAIQLFPLARKNFGGVKTDPQMPGARQAFSSPSPGSTRRASSRAWPAGISTARPVSREPCWARPSSAAASPAAGPPRRRVSARGSKAGRTGARLTGLKKRAVNGNAMPVRFHLLDAMDELPARLKQDVMQEVEAANERIAHLIRLDRLDIVVAPEAWALPDWGITGYANGPGRITITLDPGSPRLRDRERSDRILATLAHETHHVARLRTGVETYTLGGRLVSEGLAQCFEEEAGAPTPFYAVSLDQRTMHRMAERALPLLSATDFEHDAWMFGRKGDPEWPRSAGYSLGYALVKAWLGRQGLSAADAAGVPATDVTDDWRAGRISTSVPAA